jgi:hypothetical protein
VVETRRIDLVSQRALPTRRVPRSFRIQVTDEERTVREFVDIQYIPGGLEEIEVSTSNFNIRGTKWEGPLTSFHVLMVVQMT